mmetsp:Transcript_119382/g.234566  ORF Transcript_119382/g.234566 Transcript_119382/m.234566 type:complete len:286 (+) Transcript_119382:83-940(+)
MATATCEARECCGAPATPAGGPGAAGWDTMASWYTSNISPATASLAFNLLSHLGAFAAAGEGLKFLETHCGDAKAASTALPLPGVASYTACDFSAGMLAVGQAGLGDKATTVCAESTALPFEAESFDRYMSNMGCCCVSDLDAKLREAYRVLRPGGVAAMSMRIEGGENDTAFQTIGEALNPFGFPPPPQREGLLLGKDLPALKAKWESFGFKNPIAWRTWVVLPIHDEDAFMNFATGQPPVQKFLGTLDDAKRQEALKVLREKAGETLSKGAFQISVAAVVVRK